MVLLPLNLLVDHVRAFGILIIIKPPDRLECRDAWALRTYSPLLCLILVASLWELNFIENFSQFARYSLLMSFFAAGSMKVCKCTSFVFLFQNLVLRALLDYLSGFIFLFLICIKVVIFDRNLDLRWWNIVCSWLIAHISSTTAKHDWLWMLD